MDLDIDVSQITALASRSTAAPARVSTELRQAGTESGLAVQRTAQSLIPRKSGTAANLTRMEPVQASSSGVTVIVSSTAQSKDGFPYPIALEKGRKGFGPVRKKVLHFVAGGKEVFTKHVGPAAAHPFMQPALTQNEAFVFSRFEAAYDRLLKWIAG